MDIGYCFNMVNIYPGTLPQSFFAAASETFSNEGTYDRVAEVFLKSGKQQTKNNGFNGLKSALS